MLRHFPDCHHLTAVGTALAESLEGSDDKRRAHSALLQLEPTLTLTAATLDIAAQFRALRLDKAWRSHR